MLPAQDDMVVNILAFYAESTADERANGFAWYPTAYAEAEAIEARTGIPADTAAAVIAALSPQMEWNANVRWANEVCDAWVAGRPLPRRGLGNSLARAERALNGDREDIRRTKGTLKVRNFYGSIVAEPNAVCVDRHAIRIVLGDPLGTPPSLTDARYLLAAEAYREAARELRVGARHLQAVTWLVCKRIREAENAYANLPSWWRVPVAA